MPTELAPAIRVLVAGGVANLVLSFLLGWVLSAFRMKEAMDKHHWLLTAHVVSLQEGVMLLGLSYAMTFAKLSPGLASAAAWLLVVGSAFQDGSGIANWLRRTKDQFAERSFGWILATINALLNTAGLLIAAYGVAMGLMAP